MTRQIEMAAQMVKPGMSVSFGGGQHVRALIDAVAVRNLDISVTSPLALVRDYCRQVGFSVIDAPQQIDLGFDGCDAVDGYLNLLKSMGGIFVDEKAYATLCTEYVILTPEARVQPTLDTTIPLTLEVVPIMAAQVVQAAKNLDLDVRVRPVVQGERGNRLLDCFCKADEWARIREQNAALTQVNGVVGSSLFTNLATQVLIETPDDGVRML
ncbi:ribose-5-phosphate isomerase A [Lacticaseibacillus sharpeae]|nr:ribose-5-phosphate isomerase A [Lacticaseibacillus sharpeae]